MGTIYLNQRKDTKFKEARGSWYLYQNKLPTGQAFFQDDMAYRDFEDLPRKATSDHVLCDKAFTIANDPKCDEHESRIASIVYKFKFFDKKVTKEHEAT